jgi:PAP2 superfamily
MLLIRPSEWISIVAFGGLTVLAWRHNLDRARQAKISFIGGAAIAVTVFASVILPLFVSPPVASAVRNWVPALFLLLFYWQAGQFVTRADTEVEMRLERLDQRWVAPWLQWCSDRRVGHWILSCLEAAYCSYYVAIPLAVGALYLFGKQSEADYFWTVVLIACYGSCGVLPFVQTRPPRMLGEKWTECLPCGKVRALNLWILRHGSIQANTIPSAHVAITTACALVLVQVGAGWAGPAFIVLAIGVALGAVAGRYHYGTDAVLGLILAMASFLASNALGLGR